MRHAISLTLFVLAAILTTAATAQEDVTIEVTGDRIYTVDFVDIDLEFSGLDNPDAIYRYRLLIEKQVGMNWEEDPPVPIKNWYQLGVWDAENGDEEHNYQWFPTDINYQANGEYKIKVEVREFLPGNPLSNLVADGEDECDTDG